MNDDTAIIGYHDLSNVEPIIDRFRFYAEHITTFLDRKGKLVKRFPGLNKISIDLCKIQPSQFYVSREKVNAIEEFINRETDVIIPIKEYRDRRISLDGHTRLYIAKQKGFAKVPGFFAETDDHIYRFVKEAVRRGIKSVPDLKLVSPEEYEILFCGEFFQNIKSSQKTLTY